MATKRLADDHIKLMIGEHIKFCQTTMLPVIKDVDKKADKAHARIDCDETRLIALDHPKVGQVTILWSERNKVIGIALILLALIVANLFVSGSVKIDRAELKTAVKEALTEIKP